VVHAGKMSLNKLIFTIIENNCLLMLYYICPIA